MTVLTGYQIFKDIDPGNSDTLEDLVDKVFYGARLNPQTGQAYVDIIAGDATIKLPDVSNLQPTDYINWMFTLSTFGFTWNNSNGHLLLEVY